MVYATCPSHNTTQTGQLRIIPPALAPHGLHVDRMGSMDATKSSSITIVDIRIGTVAILSFRNTKHRYTSGRAS